MRSAAVCTFLGSLVLLLAPAALATSSTQKPKPPNGSGKNAGGSLPGSVAARLRQMGCSGDDFHLIMCARPHINAYCQNMRANGASCHNAGVSGKAQACLNASGTDAPIGNALAAYDAVNAELKGAPSSCRHGYTEVTSNGAGGCNGLASMVAGFHCASRDRTAQGNAKRLLASARKDLESCQGYEHKKLQAALTEALSRGETAVSKARMICEDPNGGHQPGTAGSQKCSSVCDVYRDRRMQRDNACGAYGEGSACQSSRRQLGRMQMQANQCRCPTG